MTALIFLGAGIILGLFIARIRTRLRERNGHIHVVSPPLVGQMAADVMDTWVAVIIDELNDGATDQQVLSAAATTFHRKLPRHVLAGFAAWTTVMEARKRMATEEV